MQQIAKSTAAAARLRCGNKVCDKRLLVRLRELAGLTSAETSRAPVNNAYGFAMGDVVKLEALLSAALKEAKFGDRSSSERENEMGDRVLVLADRGLVVVAYR